MSDVKYYALKRGEDFPSEFCAIDDSDGEPGEYRYYVPESENAKLRELAKKLYGGYMVSCNGCENAYEDDGGYTPLDPDCCVFSFSDRYVGCLKRKRLEAEMCELGVEVD